jgi:glycosyltransferase involved in cell wall biosynthesis
MSQPIGETYSRKDRRAAALHAAGTLAGALRDRGPRVALSAGNHFHELAAAAAKLARPNWSGSLIGRVSNDLPRFSWAPHLVPWSIYKRILARQRLNRMDRLIAVSQSLRSDLVYRLLIPGSKISVIPNGIDLQHARERAAQPLDHPWFEEGLPPVIVGAGRLVKQKNFLTLIRAFASARKQVPIRLIILGDGPSRAKLENSTKSLGVSGDVIFAGFVPNPMPYFARAALFVLPSKWEGMSNALLEALAVGCPTIATSCPGSVEVLGDGLSRQIVPVGAVEALTSAIVRDLGHPPDRRLFRERAAIYDLRHSLDLYVRMIGEELSRSA